MQIDINEKEACVIVNALRGYIVELKTSNEELLELDVSRGRHGGCCGDGGEGHARLQKTLWEVENSCTELRDKLKKYLMQFPCEEHKNYSKYDSACENPNYWKKD